VFADLKNDFIFRKIFTQNPDLMAALLSDLLELEGDERIAHVDILPPDQAPEIPSFKLSIVDVKCRQHNGRVFVVEMQLAHFTGFLHRAVYNASKAFVMQLPQGGKYHELKDVVAVSICNFALWPDAERARQGKPLIPMLSRWRMQEVHSGVKDELGQVQYAFLELGKLREEMVKESLAAAWAWLFVKAPELGEFPSGLPTEAHKRALELANEATFTEGEREAYRKMQDEIDAALNLAEQAEKRGEARGKADGLREGKEEGLREGKAAGLRAAVADLCEVLGVELTEARKAQLAGLEVAGLEALRLHLKQHRSWPA
jgi:predicted transposase/invertase (TIGR01784 family)